MTGWWGQGAMLGAALVLALGLCLCGSATHGDEGHHGGEMSQDLCPGMIVASLVIAVLAGPLVSGWVQPEPLRLVYAASPHLPDPPPKLVSLA